MGSKRLKSEEKLEEEDRITDLPDHIIQHILSFLPSTKEAIRTGILSKRWKNQWTHVSVLIFNSIRSGMSSENFLQFIDKTLIQHDCSKIIKFHLNLSLFMFTGGDPADFASMIRFATSKYVEDLDLSFRGYYLLPEFIFNNADSLVKLRTLGCTFIIPNGKVNWGFLKVLKIQRCKLTDEAIQHILSGSPLLESFELDCYFKIDRIVIASKSLKRLVLLRFGRTPVSVLEISCPKLKELSVDGMNTNDPKLFARAIEIVLSCSLLLESMSIKSISCDLMLDQLVIASESLKSLVLGNITSDFGIEISCPKLKELSLDGMTMNDPKSLAQAIERVLSGSLSIESMSIKSISCGRMLDQLVIASESLKRLALGDITSDFDIEISCPKLERLMMFECLNVNTAKLLNLPSTLCVVVNFHCPGEELKTHKSLIEDILLQLQHVLALVFGSWFIKILSTIKVGGGFSPMLNVKLLALDSPHLKKHHLGIANLLRISPMIEELVISVPTFYRKVNHKIGNNYWSSNTTVFDCLESHLKTIMIICFGLPQGDVIRQHMLNLVEFLLKNARVLEKMVVIVKDDGTGYPLEVSQELLNLPRCSQNVIIELQRT